MAPGVSIDRASSVCNAPVEDFIHRRHLNALRGNVARARTHVNNSWSRPEEERLQASRIGNVKRRQTTHDTEAEMKRENLRLMLRFQEMDKAALRRSASTPTMRKDRTPAGSNVGSRAKELSRIESENRRMLQRLRGAKASVSVSKLEQEHRQREKVMHMRLEFPSSALAHAEDARRANGRIRALRLAKELEDQQEDSLRLPPLMNPALAAAMVTEAMVREEFDRPPTGGSVNSSAAPAAAAAAVAASVASAGLAGAAPEDSGAVAQDDEHAGGIQSDFEELRLGLNLGIGMPSQSKMLANRLLEADASERAAAAEAAAAKDALEKAMKDAEAMDAEEEAMLGYDNVVKWYDEVQARRTAANPERAQIARRRELLAEVRAGIDQ